MAMLVPGFVWARLDARVWPWDQAQYAEVTLKTLGAFQHGADAGVRSMMFLLDFRAPGLTWLGVPYALLGRWLDRPEPALLCATLTWQAGTLLASYWSAYLISRSRLAAFAVAAFIGSTPLFVGMNHQFLVEPLQTLAVALSFLVMLRAKEMSGEGLLLAICAVSALAMGAKASSPLYCTLPLVYAALVLATRQSFSPIRSSPPLRALLFLGAVGSLALVGLWYVSHFNATLENVRQSTAGSIALNYGRPGDFVTKLAYWSSSFAVAVVVVSPLVLLAAGAGAGAALGFQRRRGQALRADPTPEGRTPVQWVVAAAALHLIAVFVTYSLQINDDTRFLAPLLPISAILLAWLCSLRWQVLVSSVLLATALANYLLAYSYALGFSPPANVQHPWLQVADRDRTHRDQLQEVVALTCERDKGERDKGYTVNVVGVDYAWLSQYSANFYAAAAHAGRPGCVYDSLGYATSDADRALRSVGSNYYIGIRPEKMPPEVDRHLNLLSSAIFARVSSSDQWEHVRTIDDTVVIFARRPLR